MSTTSRGNYYKRRTKEWYEKQGFVCQLSEFTCGIMAGRKTFYRKVDLFGSDLICMNGKEIVFTNSKATTEDREDGISKMKSEAKIESKHLAIVLSSFFAGIITLTVGSIFSPIIKV